jgi:uncharacterized repeat protein (TIGR01451 family)
MISTVRRGLTAVAALAAGTALVAGGLGGPAMASSTAGPTAAVATTGPKPATVGDPTITIRVGGVRTAENGPPGPPNATGLAGVTFRVAPASTGFADTCVSTAAGLCTLHVTANRTYTVTQVGTPAGWFANPALATGSGAAVVSRTYHTLGVRVGTANVTIPDAAPNSDTSPTARSGTWAVSKDDPPLPAACGLRIALLIDLSGSVGPNLATYKAAARAFVESLAGTPSSIAIYTYGTTAPAPGAANATLAPVSVAAKAGVAALVSKINGLKVPPSSGTNWDAGLWQVAGDNPRYHFQSTVIITDGDPTFYGPTGNGGRGNTTRFEEVENGVFSANALKAQGTSVISVGIGTAHEGLASTDNIRAVSGPSADSDYFNTDFQRLSHLLAQLALHNCAGLDITKTAAPPTYDHVGQQITYTYTVTNPRFFALHHVHVTDDRIGHNVGCSPSTLATGDAAACTAEYAITQADLDAGHVTNTARATGLTPNDDAVLSGLADATVSARQLPAIHLAKSASPATYAAAGEMIHYTYTVTNTGNVTLHRIALTDNRLGPVTCAFTRLAPGHRTTCSAAHVTTQADVDAGRIANAADVTGHPPNGPPVTGTADATVDAIHHPGIALLKTAFPAQYAEPGETIGYTYSVTNTGNVTLHSIALTDNRLGAVICPDATLAPGEVMTCTAEHVTTQADVDRGDIANTADVTGYPPAGRPVTGTDRDTVHAIHAPGIQLGKSSSPGTFGAAGETITYSYQVTNSGNVTLRRIALADSPLGMITCPDTTLAPGESMTCTAAYITTQADVDRGDVENAAVVTGRPPAGPPVTDADTEAVPAIRRPQIDLVKSAFPADYGTAGEQITYTYTVTNSGNVTLHNVALTDSRLGAVACLTATLAPGQSTTCLGYHLTTQADVDAGQITNAAIVAGDPPTGPPVTDGATDAVYATRAPAIAERKTAFPMAYGAPGEKITYTYTVTNTGNETLRDVTLTDNQLGDVGCPATILAPGESMTCQAVKVTTEAEVAEGKLTNVATVTGRPPTGPPVTDGDAQTVYVIRHPGIAVAKTPSPATYDAPGTAITYTYTVVNTGDVTLHDVTLTDDRLGAVTCAASTLAPGAATSCRAVHITTPADVSAGSILNIAAAGGRSPGGALVTGRTEAIARAVPLPPVPVTG